MTDFKTMLDEQTERVSSAANRLGRTQDENFAALMAGAESVEAAIDEAMAKIQRIARGEDA